MAVASRKVQNFASSHLCQRKKWNVNPLGPLVRDRKLEATTMRGVLLWLLGVPISVIILLYLFHVI
jgi:hypothetical protein